MDSPTSTGHDSAIAYREDDVESTISLGSDAFDFLEEHGRTYHRYRPEANHPFPNDRQAQEVEDELHDIYSYAFDDRLHQAPVYAPQNVLDLGAGTGTWAIQFADKHPESIVLGLDLSPIQPEEVPPNCIFHVFDVEIPWQFRQSFDYVHARNLHCSIYEPERLVKQAFDNMSPGAWLEIQEATSLKIQAPRSGHHDHEVEQGKYLKTWTNLYSAAVRLTGRDSELAPGYETIMREVGFVRVEVVRKVLPLGTWPRDFALKQLGAYVLENFLRGLQGASLRLFTQTLGWTPEEVEKFLAFVSKDAREGRVHAYMTLYTIYGQKQPRTDEEEETEAIPAWLHGIEHPV